MSRILWLGINPPISFSSANSPRWNFWQLSYIDGLPKMAHTVPTKMRINRTMGLRICRNLSMLTTINAMNIGQIQYPNIDTDWKYDILPPNTFILNVTITAPMNTAKINTIKVVESFILLNCTVYEECKY